MPATSPLVFSFSPVALLASLGAPLKRRVSALLAGAMAFTISSCQESQESAAIEPEAPPQFKVEGETMEFQVLERSDHPGHKTSEYADCLFTARLQMLDPKAGGEPKLVMGAIPAFLDRTLQTGAALRGGDRIRAVVVPFDKAPANYRRVQTADRFGDYLLDYYLLTRVEVLATRNAGEVETPVMAETAPPVIPRERFVRGHGEGPLADLRKARLEREKARIDAMLQANGGTWDEWQKRLRPTLIKLDTIGRETQFAAKKDQLYFNRLPLRNYAEICEDEPHSGPLGGLRLLNAELHRRGIDLLVVPFPTKEDVNAPRFTGVPDETELNPQRVRFHRLLLEHNIEVLDLAPALRAGLAKYPWIYFDNRDVHPADGGVQVAATEITKVLRDYGLGGDDVKPLPVEDTFMHITAETPGFTLGAKYPVTRVLFPETSSVPLDVQRRVIFQGDSFLHVPTHFVKHATVADHVGRLVGFEPETGLREAGANLVLQDLARYPKEKLEGRQVLVFVFGPTRLRSPRSGLARADYEWHQALLPE